MNSTTKAIGLVGAWSPLQLAQTCKWVGADSVTWRKAAMVSEAFPDPGNGPGSRT